MLKNYAKVCYRIQVSVRIVQQGRPFYQKTTLRSCARRWCVAHLQCAAWENPRSNHPWLRHKPSIRATDTQPVERSFTRQSTASVAPLEKFKLWWTSHRCCAVRRISFFSISRLVFQSPVIIFRRIMCWDKTSLIQEVPYFVLFSPQPDT
jgi:hypothetical protein